MRIEVTNREPEENKWKDKEGNERVSLLQWAVLHIDGLPTAFQFSSDVALPPGPAELSTRSFNVVNGRLQLTRAQVVSIAASKPAPTVAKSV